MAKHVVGKAEDVGPGMRKVFEVRGRPIVIFNVDGDYFALLNRCPHQGAELSMGIVAGIATAEEPGRVRCSRRGEFIRCPWHGWEFDIRTGQSWCDPARISVRQFPVSITAGAELIEGPYKAETFPVSIQDSYLVVDL